jgi:hypothetical protein
LGELRLHDGDLDAAEALHRRALAIREAKLGADHHDVAFSLLGLSRVALARKDAATAKPLCERALALFRAADPDPLDVAEATDLLGRALLLEKDESAERTLDEARASYEKIGANALRLMNEHDAFRRANR